MKEDVQHPEEQNFELQDMPTDVSTDDQIETIMRGRFTDDVHACCYDLLG